MANSSCREKKFYISNRTVKLCRPTSKFVFPFLFLHLLHTTPMALTKDSEWLWERVPTKSRIDWDKACRNCRDPWELDVVLQKQIMFQLPFCFQCSDKTNLALSSALQAPHNTFTECSNLGRSLSSSVFAASKGSSSLGRGDTKSAFPLPDGVNALIIFVKIELPLGVGASNGVGEGRPPSNESEDCMQKCTIVDRADSKLAG